MLALLCVYHVMIMMILLSRNIIFHYIYVYTYIHYEPGLKTSNCIDLLGITETWLSTRETSADLAEMTPLLAFLLPETSSAGKRGRSGLVNFICPQD